MRLCATFVALHSAYVVYVGGDFYPGSRFLVVVTPFVYLLITRLLAGFHAWAQARWPSLGSPNGVFGANAAFAFFMANSKVETFQRSVVLVNDATHYLTISSWQRRKMVADYTRKET